MQKSWLSVINVRNWNFMKTCVPLFLNGWPKNFVASLFKIDTSLVDLEACWEARSPQRWPSPWLSWFNGLGKIPETMVFYPTKWCCPRCFSSFWGYSEVDHGHIQNGIPSVWILLSGIPPNFFPWAIQHPWCPLLVRNLSKPSSAGRASGCTASPGYRSSNSNWSRRDGRTMRVSLPEGVWFFPLG